MSFQGSQGSQGSGRSWRGEHISFSSSSVETTVKESDIGVEKIESVAQNNLPSNLPPVSVFKRNVEILSERFDLDRYENNSKWIKGIGYGLIFLGVVVLLLAVLNGCLPPVVELSTKQFALISGGAIGSFAIGCLLAEYAKKRGKHSDEEKEAQWKKLFTEYKQLPKEERELLCQFNEIIKKQEADFQVANDELLRRNYDRNAWEVLADPQIIRDEQCRILTEFRQETYGLSRKFLPYFKAFNNLPDDYKKTIGMLIWAEQEASRLNNMFEKRAAFEENIDAVSTQTLGYPSEEVGVV
ncbi:MAG TPA: hypothetical protein VGJ00_08720 [Rhabdochlamydiaceae bacterium]|jgi:hypothetical protein